MSAQPQPAARIGIFEDPITPEEYLEFERRSEERHEYVEGYVFAMAGTSADHGQIIHVINGLLFNQLRGKPCQVFTENMRLKMPSAYRGAYYYPDVLVACDPTDRAYAHRERPTVIFEVLSPDDPPETGPRDKMVAYLNLFPSLQTYVIVWQDRVRVRAARRAADGWEDEELTSLGDTLRLPEIGCALPLAEVYERVSWRAAGSGQ